MKNNDKLDNDIYVIGELGQNHNGSTDIAKLIIDLVSRPVVENTFNLTFPSVNAVKLQKRDLSDELTQSQMEKVYDNPNSFGRTYGEHRLALELTDQQHFDIYKHAKMKGLDFIETLCSIKCLSLLELFTPDYLKVASRDLTNLPLIEALAKTEIPIILSTGMSGEVELDQAINIILKFHSDISILHCVSEYPTEPKNLNLNGLQFLLEKYKQFKIGFSDHTIGIAAPLVAIGLGARIIEKHITIDRTMKGTDQIGSLGPDGVRRMMRDVRLSQLWMGKKTIEKGSFVDGAKNKLERSIATNKNMKVGDVVHEGDLVLLSPGNGIKWIERNKVIGKTLTKNISMNELIFEEDLN